MVLTDGKSDDETAEIAASLRANGVKMFAVAIGDEVDMTDLRGITNDEKSVFQVRYVSSFVNLLLNSIRHESMSFLALQ